MIAFCKTTSEYHLSVTLSSLAEPLQNGLHGEGRFDCSGSTESLIGDGGKNSILDYSSLICTRTLAAQRAEQLLVSAFFENGAIVQDQNPVGHSDR